MSDKEKAEQPQTTVNEKNAVENAAVENPADTMTEEAAAEQPEELDETAKLTAEIEELKAKIEKQQKDYLLLMADYDNFRKRTLKEKSDLLKYGGEACMKNILPVIDDFERGLQSVNESTDLDAVKEGMNLIYNKFQSYLAQNGVKEVPAVGETFDTEHHEAVTMFPAQTPEQKGKVIDCVQKGYSLNDKVIRFAKVVVGQ